MNARNHYLINLMIAIDVLGNALTGGSRWHTISARTGYHAFGTGASRGGRQKLWKWLANVIDWSFKPVQGKGHCRNAWQKEASVISGGGRFQGGNAIGTVMAAIPIVVLCPLIYATNLVLSWIGVKVRNPAGW